MNAIVPFDPASQAHGSGVSAKIAFVYPGHGAQWPRMAAELLDSSPPFAARMSECADALAPFLGWSPVDVLRGSGEALEAGAPEVVQPVLFAVMVSLTALWEAHGVTPDAVIGHSIGEASAGYVAGALSLADAARVVASCSRAQARLAGRGEMASVMLSATAMRERLARWHGNVVVAVINGPAAVLISGDRDAVTEEVASLNAEGISARLMPLGVAAHSPGIDEVGEEVREPLAPIAPLTPSIPLYSSLNGGRVVVPMDAGYWFRMLREPVQFDPAVRVLLDDGYNVFIEVSPHPVLCGAIADTADDHAVQDVVVANTLRRGEGNLRYFYTQAAEIFARGKITEEGLKEKLSLLSAAGQRRALLRLIRDQAAIIIRSPGALDEQRTFFELGFDSAAAVELRNRLRRVTGLSLPSSLVFNYPTPARLAERLYEEFAGPVDHAVNAVADGGDPIAIVGMACRFAGGTDSPELLWRLVDDGRDVISGLPADRGWDLAGLYDPDPERAGRTYVRAGGFLRDAGDFDAEFFGISPREALAMDPQQRVLLECA